MTTAFPTSVGMNRPTQGRLARPTRVPHERGDEPGTEFSVRDLGSAFPTSVGMNCSGSHDCPKFLDAGKSCTLTGRFKPKARGTRTGEITITTSASNSPIVVALTSKGKLMSPGGAKRAKLRRSQAAGG